MEGRISFFSHFVYEPTGSFRRNFIRKGTYLMKFEKNDDKDKEDDANTG